MSTGAARHMEEAGGSAHHKNLSEATPAPAYDLGTSKAGSLPVTKGSTLEDVLEPVSGPSRGHWHLKLKDIKAKRESPERKPRNVLCRCYS